MIKLHQNGTDLYTIKQITGDQDFKSLERYVELDSDRVRGAINALSTPNSIFCILEAPKRSQSPSPASCAAPIAIAHSLG